MCTTMILYIHFTHLKAYSRLIVLIQQQKKRKKGESCVSKCLPQEVCAYVMSLDIKVILLGVIETKKFKLNFFRMGLSSQVESE